jgi:hypothetical protein
MGVVLFNKTKFVRKTFSVEYYCEPAGKSNSENEHQQEEARASENNSC